MSRAPTPAAASAPLLMLPLVLLVLVCGVPASVVIPSVQPVVARSSFGGGRGSYTYTVVLLGLTNGDSIHRL